MSWRSSLLDIVNIPLNGLGVHALPRHEYRTMRTIYEGPTWQTPSIAAEDRAYLTLSNPRFEALRDRYKGHPATAHSQWSETNVLKRLVLADFRGDNHYVYQARHSPSPESYCITAYYMRDIDSLDLFGRLLEDGKFGAYVLPFESGYPISRDLLDSINEINFIYKILGLNQDDGVKLLDIGAGYGRLASRIAEGFPRAHVTCTDAVPLSTFLCEFYLRFRGASDRVEVVPLDEVIRTLSGNKFDIVTNIHSFSECPLAAIEWWLRALQNIDVSKLMIIPNAARQFLSTEHDGSHRDYATLLQSCGWRHVHGEPIFAASEVAQKYGLYPNFRFFLFERT
jgi:putative sugar O-methyltransferase